MASKSDNAEIAVLQTQMEEVKLQLHGLDVKVDQLLNRFEVMSNSFVTQSQLTEFKNELRRRTWSERIALIGVTAIITALATAPILILFHVRGN